ncbi:hypothetical protein [Vibrio owensii]|uniref:hypothetical protein n=1 Tax=Vibrio owensii TaxID=696485 RepID=UPI0003A3019D|nr:hypothetical protein [Vibrio owensii]
MIYFVDKSEFQNGTGVSFDSDKGVFFRRLAIKSLTAFKFDVAQQSFPNKALAHRLKGITSASGCTHGTHLCKKLEHYNDVISEKHVRVILNDIASALITELD